MDRTQIRLLRCATFPKSICSPVRVLAAATLLLATSCGCVAQLSMPAAADPAATNIESGIRLLRSRDAAAAKLQFSAGVKANSRSADALTWRGIAENQLKQYTEAIRDFEAALRIDPNELPAHYNLALSQIRTGQSDSAIEQLRTVVKATPGALEAEFNLAILLEAKHLIPEAIEHLQAAYKTQSNDLGVIKHLLIDLLAVGRVDELQPLLDQLQTADSVEVTKEVGTALLEAGQFGQTIHFLEGARERSASNREADLLLARAYIGAQEDFKAISLLKPAEITDSTGESAYLLGMAYLDMGAIQEAKSAFERAIKSNPRNSRAVYHLGMIEAANPEQLTAAILHLRAAIRLEPDTPAYGIALGKILLQQDKAQEAMVTLQRVQAEGGEAAQRDLLLGISLITVNGPTQAIPVLLRAVAENASLALPYNILGFCYFVQGDLPKATASYKQASDLSPETRIFAHGAAVAFDRANDSSQAMIYATRAVALPGANGEDHYLVGKLLAKDGRTGDAIRELNEAIALNPDLDQAYYLLGRTYMQTGDAARATEWMSKLKELKQKHERAYAEERKNAKPISSSTLLQGAPMAGSETAAP